MTTTVSISGMSCVHCVRAVFTALSGVEGIDRAEVAIGRAVIEHDGSVTPEQIRDAIAVAVLEIIAGLFCLIALVSGLSALIRRATTELAVTDRRVIYKTGILQRHSMEMNRSKVETVGVNQSILGRVLGYGTVIVRGTGGSFEPIQFIGDPLTRAASTSVSSRSRSRSRKRKNHAPRLCQ